MGVQVTRSGASGVVSRIGTAGHTGVNGELGAGAPAAGSVVFCGWVEAEAVTWGKDLRAVGWVLGAPRIRPGCFHVMPAAAPVSVPGRAVTHSDSAPRPHTQDRFEVIHICS